MNVPLFQLMHQCEATSAAKVASDYASFIQHIQSRLDICLRMSCDHRLDYVTIDPYHCHAADADSIAWTYMLYNYPRDPLCFLDSQQKDLLQRALNLAPEDFCRERGYDESAVAKALHCSAAVARYVTQYWEIAPMYPQSLSQKIQEKFRNLIHMTPADASKASAPNMDYLMKVCPDPRHATKLLQTYTGWTYETAQATVQQYAKAQHPTLARKYPSGEQALYRGTPAVKFALDYKNRCALWSQLPHPMFLAHSKAPEETAAQFYKGCFYAKKSATAYLFEDGHIAFGGYHFTGSEDDATIKFHRGEQFSYHDGGGGYEKNWTFEFLSDAQAAPKSLLTGTYSQTLDVHIPSCRGYWEAGKSLYLVDPCGMEGIFRLTFIETSWD